jgi:hypothetical protein
VKKLLENWNSFVSEANEQEELVEYVVPVGYSLERWQAKRKEDKITNADWHKDHPEARWKVVHGHKKGEIGDPVNDKAKNMSYEDANKMHSAIAISQGA